MSVAMGLSVQEPSKARRQAAGLPLFSYGFRPFFLLAAGYAAIAMALWIALLRGWPGPPLAMAGVAWHAHEMFFGFAGAGVAGFLLTAVPNWTGKPPVKGWPLAVLAGVWLAGRGVMIFGEGLGPVPVAVVDLLFLVAVLGVAGSAVIAAGNRRNLPILGMLALLGVANGLTHAAAFDLDGDWAGVGRRLGMHLFLLLIALVGGRIVPAFTGNWLAQTGRAEKPLPFGNVDKATLAAAAAAALADTAAPGTLPAGGLLVVAGVLHLVRLGRWRGHLTLGAPIVWVLHLGYLWLAVGSLLLGLSALTDGVPRIAGVHALTAGAIGTMFVAVMSRASLGHTGRALIAGPATVTVYGLVTLAALTRTLAPWFDAAFTELLAVSAAAWIAGYGLFFVAYLPVWVGPRADGK
jgi:uncharacterized protein involved in response to NO